MRREHYEQDARFAEAHWWWAARRRIKTRILGRWPASVGKRNGPEPRSIAGTHYLLVATFERRSAREGNYNGGPQFTARQISSSALKMALYLGRAINIPGHDKEFVGQGLTNKILTGAFVSENAQIPRSGRSVAGRLLALAGNLPSYVA